jgi:hypothetical protein
MGRNSLKAVAVRRGRRTEGVGIEGGGGGAGGSGGGAGAKVVHQQPADQHGEYISEQWVRREEEGQSGGETKDSLKRRPGRSDPGQQGVLVKRCRNLLFAPARISSAEIDT